MFKDLRFLNTNSFFGCVVDEKFVKFGRRSEAEAFPNKDEPEKCLKKEVRLFLAGQLTINWLEQRLEDLVFQ